MSTQILDGMHLTDKEYTSLTAQAANYRVILRLLKVSGLDNFLKEKSLPPIDLLITPNDTTGGESITLFLKGIADECNMMDKKITILSQALVDTNILLAQEKRNKIKISFLEKVKTLFS